MKINEDFDVAVIGAGIAGLTAAIYALRAGRSVIVLDGKGYGGQIGSADRVENYPGFASISGFDFATAVCEQAKGLGAKIKFSNITKIEKEEDLFLVYTEKILYKTKAAVIATGLEKRKLGLDKEGMLTGKGISYCATCDGAFYKDKVTAIVGGGNTALEDALYLSEHCSEVYLVHRRNEYRAEAAYVEEVNKRENIVQLKSFVPVEILGDSKVEGLAIKNSAGEVTNLAVDGVFVAIGQTPLNEVFKNLVDVDKDGYIVAGEDCTTKTEGLFVAGDCRTKQVRQLVTAAADGAVAGLGAAKYAGERL